MATLPKTTHHRAESSIGLEEDNNKTLQQQIDKMKKQLEELEKANGITGSNKKGTETTTAIQYLETATVHNTRTTIAKGIRLLILLIITAIVFGYELAKYLDPEMNKLSESKLEPITSIDIPYFYLYVGDTMKNLSVALLEIKNNRNDVTQYTVINRVYSTEFIYNSDVKNWTLIDVTADKDEVQAMLFPPYGSTINIGSALSISFRTDAFDADVDPIDLDSDYRDEVLLKLTNGDFYGFYWQVDSTNDIKEEDENVDLIKLRDSYFEIWQQLRYTFISTDNLYYIDIFEEINEINNTNTIYYSSHLVATMLEKSNLDHVYWETPTYWQYITKLTLYPNPSGGGIKTILTIKQKTSITDVLSNVGGIFAPINTFSFLVLLWAIFGVHTSKFHWNGIAPYTPLNYETKLQIKLYLIELGLLHNKQIEYERNNTIINALHEAL